MAYVIWLQDGRLEADIVGGKGSALSKLTAGGLPVPPGYCINAAGYRRFAAACGLDGASAEERGSLALQAALPDDLRAEVASAYETLSATAGVACAVRSSALGEDGASASFAGLYESHLNVSGVASVLDAIRGCYASLWAERALRYRAARGVASGDEAMAVVVMSLVPAEVSGVAFTADPMSGARDVVLINAAWGLGEPVVSGRVTPDSFTVAKGSLAILQRDVFEKQLAVYANPTGQGTVEQGLPPERATAACLSSEQAVTVARLALQVESLFGAPQDIEWSFSQDRLFLLQARQITTLR